MIKEGWVEEVQELSQTVPLTAPAWQSLGFRELLNAQGQSEINKILDKVKQQTRNYAKRQITWFSRQVNSTQINLDSENALDIITAP